MYVFLPPGKLFSQTAFLEVGVQETGPWVYAVTLYRYFRLYKSISFSTLWSFLTKNRSLGKPFMWRSTVLADRILLIAHRPSEGGNVYPMMNDFLCHLTDYYLYFNFGCHNFES